MNPNPAEEPRELTAILRKWQAIETATIDHAMKIIENTRNPLIKIVMEIIRSDSWTHFQVQQALLDSLEKEAFTLAPDELAAIWDMIEAHAEIEKKTIALAEKALEDCRLLAQRNLLGYLIEDEKKHDRLMGQLEEFKRNLYPYA